jgi:cell division protein FtsQ
MSPTPPAPPGARPRRPPRPRAHPALAERRRAIARARGRRRRAALTLAAATLLAIGALYWLATGPVLAVHGVSVSGYDRPDQADLVSALTAAAGDGTIIVPSTGEMQVAARRFPWVASISVSRSWPRGLSVRVTQATPAAVASDGTTSVLVAQDGRVLGPLAGKPGVGWVRLASPPPSPGQLLPEPALPAVAFIGAAAPSIAKQVRQLSVDSGGRLEGRLADGVELRLGTPDRLVAKARALALVLASARHDGTLANASYIDLTVPVRPAVGQREQASAPAG